MLKLLVHFHIFSWFCHQRLFKLAACDNFVINTVTEWNTPHKRMTVGSPETTINTTHLCRSMYNQDSRYNISINHLTKSTSQQFCRTYCLQVKIREQKHYNTYFSLLFCTLYMRVISLLIFNKYGPRLEMHLSLVPINLSVTNGQEYSWSCAYNNFRLHF